MGESVLHVLLLSKRSYCTGAVETTIHPPSVQPFRVVEHTILHGQFHET